MSEIAKIIPIGHAHEPPRTQFHVFWLVEVFPCIAALPAALYLWPKGLTYTDWLAFGVLCLPALIGSRLRFGQHESALMTRDAIARVDERPPLRLAASLACATLVGALLGRSLEGALTAFLFAGIIRIALINSGAWLFNLLCELVEKRAYHTEKSSQ